MPHRLCLAATTMMLCACALLQALANDPPLAESITYQADGQQRTLEGVVLIEAQDGGVLVQDRFGELFTITGESLIQREDAGTPDPQADAEELGERLRSVIGGEATLVFTEHYVIVTSGSVEFAEWAGAVLDQFRYSAIETWTEMGFEPAPPAGPLPVLILSSREKYMEFATADASAAVAQTRAYYSMRTNRMVLHDPLTEAANSPEDLTPREIDRRMDALPQSVGTLLHEATHQLAYNCGLHRRYADNPMWLTEGLAMCMETSEASRSSVDIRLTRPNAERLVDFKNYVRQRREEGSLIPLLSSEDLFRNADTQADAYCESWALGWFLIRERRDEYVAYLRTVSQKPLMTWDEPATRLAEFESAFGDLDDLEREFLRWMARR